jgi:HlyD family secretion protein
MKKSGKMIVFGFAALVAAGLFGCRKDAPGTGPLEISGLIEAISTDLRSQAQGEIKEVLVQEGQVVRAGELLCRIDDEKLRLQTAQVAAGLEAAGAKLRLARKGTKKELIAVARNQMDIAAKQLELARKDQGRLTKLLGQGAVSEIQKEKADLALKAAEEQAQSAQENYDLAVRGRESEEIEMIQAEIRGLEAQRSLLERQIRDTEIRSPVDGLLEIKHVEPGELAMPGAVLFSLIDFQRTYVKAYVPEKEIGRVKVGTPLEVRCDSFPGRSFPGKVDYISGEAEFAPKNIQTKEERLKLVFLIKAYFENPGRELKPGMPVDVTIRF